MTESAKTVRPTENFYEVARPDTAWRPQTIWLLFLLAWLAVPVAKAEVIPCGTPSYDQATDRAIFLWQDCTTGAWSVRVLAGGTQLAVDGALDSTYPFTEYTPVSVEPKDRLQSPEPTRLEYSLQTWNTWLDGFDFVLPVGANATFSLVTTGVSVLVGPNRVAVTPPFNLLDLSGAPQFDGQPTYDPATEQEAFLWRTSDGGWHLRVTGAGTATSFTGSIKSDRAFTAVTQVGLESEDILDTTNTAQIAFVFVPAGGQDGVDFSFPADSTICFTLATPDQPVLIGPDRVPIIGSFDLQTLSPCGGGTPSQDGQPAYDPGTQAGLFLWRDGPGGGWHMRVTAGGGSANYVGEIVSSEPFASVNGVSIESRDIFDTSSPNRIGFDLTVWNSGQDGIDFEFPATASVCFALQGASPTVLMGAGMTPVATPVDLTTLGACVSTGDGGLNVIVIMTDDQRFDTLSQMPNVTELLVSRGVTFNNAYVPTPLCCPSRATMYSGGFLAQNTGVLENSLPDGSVSLFHDTTNLGTVLQQAGYQTFFAGKWMNGYQRLGLYIPPGWDQFVGRLTDATNTEWSSFRYATGSSNAQNSSTGTQVSASGQYNVYFERDRLLNFLDQLQAGKPFFAFWSTTPPHPPAAPPPEDGDLFADYVYRGRGYTETDLSDKPRWVQRNGLPAGDDAFVRDQLRTLQSVDRSVADIVDKVAALGQLDNTVFIFTSDNGYQWGEHGLWGKNKVYEESVRVPLVVVVPGVAARADDHLVQSNLDIGPTVYELAGVPRQTDGMSLVPLLNDQNAPWRTEVFFEKTVSGTYDNAIWAALRRDDWKYVEYWNGEEEFYNLQTDPYELESRHNDASVSSIKASLAARTNELKGLAIVPVRNFPAGTVSTTYSYQLEPWGGVAPFTWQIYSGQLPAGLALDAATGAIQGTPTGAGTFEFSVRVTDSSVATHAQIARTYVSDTFKIIINP